MVLTETQRPQPQIEGHIDNNTPVKVKKSGFRLLRVLSWLLDGGDDVADRVAARYQKTTAYNGGNRRDDMNRPQDPAHPTPRTNVLR